MCNEFDRTMIVLSSSIESADEYIEKIGNKTVDEKIACLEKLFGGNMVGRTNKEGTTDEESKLMDYHAMLNCVINGKGKI